MDNISKEKKGEFKWRNGTRYIGEYKKDQKDGYGEFIWNENKKYRGQWKNGHMNGYGVLEKDNTLIFGQWAEDKLSKEMSKEEFNAQKPADFGFLIE